MSDPNASNSSEPSLHLTSSETSSEGEPQEALEAPPQLEAADDQWLAHFLSVGDVTAALAAVVIAALVAAAVALVAVVVALVAGNHPAEEPDTEEDNGAGIGW